MSNEALTGIFYSNGTIAGKMQQFGFSKQVPRLEQENRVRHSQTFAYSRPCSI